MPIGIKLKGDSASDRGLFGLLPSWERSLRAARLSPKTIDAYLLGVRSLNNWCIEHEEEFGLGKDLVLTYLVDALESGKLASSTMESYFKGIRIFSKWCAAEGEIEKDEVANVPSPKVDEVIQPSVSPEQWDALVAVCGNDSLSGKRDQAIFGLLRDTGLRARELVKIDLAEVNLRDQSILIHGKGRRDRFVGYSDRTAVALDRYLRARRKSKYAGSPALLVSVAAERFSYHGMYSMMKKRAAQAGLTQLNPHMFRRMFAHESLDNDLSAGDLKALGGWKSYRMVEHYAKEHENRRALKSQRAVFDKRDG